MFKIKTKFFGNSLIIIIISVILIFQYCTPNFDAYESSNSITGSPTLNIPLSNSDLSFNFAKDILRDTVRYKPRISDEVIEYVLDTIKLADIDIYGRFSSPNLDNIVGEANVDNKVVSLYNNANINAPITIDPKTEKIEVKIGDDVDIDTLVLEEGEINVTFTMNINATLKVIFTSPHISNPDGTKLTTTITLPYVSGNGPLTISHKIDLANKIFDLSVDNPDPTAPQNLVSINMAFEVQKGDGNNIQLGTSKLTYDIQTTKIKTRTAIGDFTKIDPKKQAGNSLNLQGQTLSIFGSLNSVFGNSKFRIKGANMTIDFKNSFGFFLEGKLIVRSTKVNPNGVDDFRTLTYGNNDYITVNVPPSSSVSYRNGNSYPEVVNYKINLEDVSTTNPTNFEELLSIYPDSILPKVEFSTLTSDPNSNTGKGKYMNSDLAFIDQNSKLVVKLYGSFLLHISLSDYLRKDTITNALPLNLLETLFGFVDSAQVALNINLTSSIPFNLVMKMQWLDKNYKPFDNNAVLLAPKDSLVINSSKVDKDGFTIESTNTNQTVYINITKAQYDYYKSIVGASGSLNMLLTSTVETTKKDNGSREFVKILKTNTLKGTISLAVKSYLKINLK